MKLGRLAVLGIAGVAGLAAAVIAMNLARRPAPAPAPTPATATADAPAPIPQAQVLVAAVDIPVGTTISADALSWQDWPESGLASNFIRKAGDADQIEPLVGSFARGTFYAGEPIIPQKLISAEQGFMAAILPEGMRAVATSISVVTSAGGFILPNDRVDVIMGRTNDAGRSTTEVILSNVRVLAIDQTIEDKDGEKVVVGQTATLELTPQQVEILTVAQQMSERLTLSLRSIVDATPSAADGKDAVHLLGGTKQNGAVTVVKNGVARQETGLR